MEPSSRVITDSATSAVVRTDGGGAGSSSIAAAWLTTACTTAPNNSMTSARDVTDGGAITRTAPGIVAAKRSIVTLSRRAACQRTAMSTDRSARRVERNVGTTAPCAT